MSSAAATYDQATADRAARHLLEQYAPRGNFVGWLMIASIFIESWDLYSISFVNKFLSDIYHPSSLLLGLTSAGTQGGAVVGALLGGWLSDRLGRRRVFIATMVIFIVFGIGQAFAPNMATLAAIRLVLGIPLGSDIANGYTYIMESLPAKKREVMGNRWQFMFAAGEILAGVATVCLLAGGVDHDILWRVVLAMGAIPAALLLFLRRRLPETAVWLVQKGRWAEAKAVSREQYGDSLEMLPDATVVPPRARIREFLTDTWRNDVRRRGTAYGWIASAMQSLEFSTFAFYLPVLLILIGVSGTLNSDLINIGLYAIALVSGFVGPIVTPKLGQRGLSLWGFGLVLLGLLAAGGAILGHVDWVVPIAAAVMLWGHYWDSENVMTIPSMVARPQYKGLASGTAYTWVKLPGFLGIFLFPSFFAAIGNGWATLFTAVFPLVGFLAALLILREVFGHIELAGDGGATAQPYPAGGQLPGSRIRAPGEAGPPS